MKLICISVGIFTPLGLIVKFVWNQLQFAPLYQNETSIEVFTHL